MKITPFKKIIVSVLLTAVVGGTLMFASPRPAQAFLGVGDVSVTTVLIDIKDFFYKLSMDIMSVVLQGVTEHYADQFIQKAENQFHIRNNALYALNIEHQVYNAHELQGKTPTEQYAIQSMINDIDHFPGAKPNYVGLTNKTAKNSFDVYASATSKSDADTLWSMAKMADPKSSPIYGQVQLPAQATLAKANSSAKSANEVAQGQGSKSQYDCPTTSTDQGQLLTITDENGLVEEGDYIMPSNFKTGYGAKFIAPSKNGGFGSVEEMITYLKQNGQILGQALESFPTDPKKIKAESGGGASTQGSGIKLGIVNTAQLHIAPVSAAEKSGNPGDVVACVVNNPSKYVNDKIGNMVNDLFNTSDKPVDTLGAITQFVAQTVKKLVLNKLFSSGTSTNNLLSDVSIGAGKALVGLEKNQNAGIITISDGNNTVKNDTENNTPQFGTNGGAKGTIIWDGSQTLDPKYVTLSCSICDPTSKKQYGVSDSQTFTVPDAGGTTTIAVTFMNTSDKPISTLKVTLLMAPKLAFPLP